MPMRPRSAMEPSGPCGSDRLGTSSTSSGSAPPGPLCNIEAKVASLGPANWHVACCIGGVRHKQRALCGGMFGAKRSPASPAGGLAFRELREKPNGEGNTDHQQQELLVVVDARLAADQVFRFGVRGNR